MLRITGIFLFGVGLLSAPAFSRNWTSSVGSQMEADFVSLAGNMVTLRNESGRTFRLTLAQLSAEDQAYIQSLPDDPSTGKTIAGLHEGNPEWQPRLVPGETFRREVPGDTGAEYHVFVPSSYKSDAAPTPVIISFSPGGNGKQMIQALKASAEKVGWIVVGCDKLKNGMKDESMEQKMEDEVLEDIYENLRHNNRRIYFAGMSGGAMRAYGISARREERIAGIIACGGWLGGEDYQKLPFCKYMAVAMVNGDGDVAANAWVKRDQDALEGRKCRVKLFRFQGGHVLPPSDVLDDCIAWMEEDWRDSGVKQKP